MIIHSLHQPAAIQAREKTVIKKGEIVRRTVWVDQHGNEYDRNSDKRGPPYVLTRAAAPSSSSSSVRSSFPSTVTIQPDLTEILHLLAILTGMVFFSFLSGYLVGLWRTKNSILASKKESYFYATAPTVSHEAATDLYSQPCLSRKAK